MIYDEIDLILVNIFQELKILFLGSFDLLLEEN
jgi:hypothetical protein